MAGYSETPLIKKLGIKENMKLMLIYGPKNYPEMLGIDPKSQLVTAINKADLVHLFVVTQKELREIFPKIISAAKEGLIIWVSWYKKSSGMLTDVNENFIREIVLPAGWVDIKVCAIDDMWSGLKIVKRKKK